MSVTRSTSRALSCNSGHLLPTLAAFVQIALAIAPRHPFWPLNGLGRACSELTPGALPHFIMIVERPTFTPAHAASLLWLLRHMSVTGIGSRLSCPKCVRSLAALTHRVTFRCPPPHNLWIFSLGTCSHAALNPVKPPLHSYVWPCSIIWLHGNLTSGDHFHPFG